MVSKDSVEKQLKRINFNIYAWGRSEAHELPNIILPDEEIYECVNGIYEGGFALLVATDIRVLLIDKKPLNYLTVEDLRFDMINEIDYSHRLVGARISISTGNKNLKFTSYNQPRLRKLISHVQDCMAAAKKKQSEHAEDQKTHLEQINQQLQTYLLAQHKYQQDLQERLNNTGKAGEPAPEPEPVKPSPELADYLFAQSLLAQHGVESSQQTLDQIRALTTHAPFRAAPAQTQPEPAQPTIQAPTAPDTPNPNLADLYAEGMKEIFGKRAEPAPPASAPPAKPQPQPAPSGLRINPLEINPLRIAYSKLPMALRNRKFGRPSFHAHSQSADHLAAQPPHSVPTQ